MLRVLVGIVFWICLPFAVVLVILAFFTTGQGMSDPIPTAPNWRLLIPAGACALLTVGAVLAWRRLPPTGRGWLVPLLESGMNSPIATVLSAIVVPFYTLTLFANAYLHPHPGRWIIPAIFLPGTYLSVKEAWKLWQQRRRRW